MVDPTGTIATALINNLGRLFVDGASKMGAGMQLDKATQQRWYTATGEYWRRYQKRHGQLQVLGMAKPMQLEEVYTAVQLLDAGEVRCFETLQGLEDLYRQAGKRQLGREPQGKQRGISMANQEQYLMVLGGPGIGKSTFLRKMGLEALKTVTGEYDHRKIPVLLELKDFNSDQADIETLLVAEFTACGFPNPQAFTTYALGQGNLLVLLDGLDEVPTANLDPVIRKISNFVSRYDKNRFIVSCRIAAYHSFFTGFTEVAMAEFDDEQIEEFIHNYFCSELDQKQNTAQVCWDLLQRPANAPAKELAQTPLLLTYLCLVYDGSQTFPPSRSALYGEALDILLQKWAAEKRINRDPIYQGLHGGLEKTLLAAIAFPSFAQNQLFLEEQRVLDLITEFLADTLDAPKTLDAGKVLMAIEVQQGILVKRGQNTYSFSHLTLQEYLTAFEINDQRKTDWLIENHLGDDRWREIFLLVTGLLGRQADDFLAKMEQKAQTYINTPELINLLEYLEWISQQSHNEYTSLQRRLDIIWYVVNIANCNFTFTANTDGGQIAKASQDVARVAEDANIIRNIDTLAVHHTSIPAAIAADYINTAIVTAMINTNATTSYPNNASNYANAAVTSYAYATDVVDNSNSTHPKIFYFQENFDLNQFNTQIDYLKKHEPKKKVSRKEKNQYIKRYQDLFHSMFDTSRGILSLSEQEWRNLEKYLKVVKLILDCKDAAVRVSRTAWKQLEARLLTVPEEKKVFKK